jgi:hypothetical protein
MRTVLVVVLVVVLVLLLGSLILGLSLAGMQDALQTMQ